ncbi:unnamed protein product [Agarophyton chilense]
MASIAAIENAFSNKHPQTGAPTSATPPSVATSNSAAASSSVVAASSSIDTDSTAGEKKVMRGRRSRLIANGDSIILQKGFPTSFHVARAILTDPFPVLQSDGELQREQQPEMGDFLEADTRLVHLSLSPDRQG